MTPDEVKQSITGWCSTDDDLSSTGDQTEPGTEFAVGIRAGGAGGPVEVQVLQGQGADRITVRHTASVASASADAAQKLLDSRPGWLTGTVDRGVSGTTATAQTYVYLDGLSKHSFVQAVAEVARAARLLGVITTSAAETVTPAVTATALPAYAAPVPTAQPAVPVGQPMAAPSFTPQPQVQAVPPQPTPQAGPWVPTHSVPPQGLRAWQAPDPSGPVVANLAPGLPIQVSEVRGAWARVICSNGWTGWIDGRIIGVAA
jgi:hypothetical protein